MATLTETAYYTRKGVKLTIAAIVGIFILRILIGMGQQIWLAIFPPREEEANVAFGLLPKLDFPATTISSTSGKLSYTIETVDGGLPVFPKKMKVYLIPKVGSTFGKDEKMRAQAQRLGFSLAPEKIFGEIDKWRFSDATYPLRHLDYDATLGNFHLYYDYSFDLNLFANKYFPQTPELIKNAQAYFSGLGLLHPDLAEGSQKVFYFKLSTNSLIPTTSLSDSDAVLININRGDIVEEKSAFPIINADPYRANVSLLFSGSQDKGKKVLEANYSYSGIDYENFATYPVITAAAAYELLKSGKAYVAALPANKQTISIRQIYLGYFDAPRSQKYLQPVIIFSDTKGFEAYVPAVNPSLFAP